jgi:hypothetical protein
MTGTMKFTPSGALPRPGKPAESKTGRVRAGLAPALVKYRRVLCPCKSHLYLRLASVIIKEDIKV